MGRGCRGAQRAGGRSPAILFGLDAGAIRGGEKIIKWRDFPTRLDIRDRNPPRRDLAEVGTRGASAVFSYGAL